MKNQSSLQSRSNSDKVPASKEKRKWKKPEIIEENYRNTEQDPVLPMAPGQGDQAS